MNIDLQAALPELLPKAIAWAEVQYSLISELGKPLTEDMKALAQKVGVLHPANIRILEVPSIPLPDDPGLQQAALASGLLGTGIVGLTLGYGIYVCYGHGSTRLLSHEFRHVHQYEQAGSISNYLPVYLQQLVSVGYKNAPFEIDARTHEIKES
jgi:hypothetical protein